jgi:cytoskeletal protein CcmA (bactofilin family)
MAFFSRDEPPSESAPHKAAAAPTRNEPAATTTRVAPGSRFEGKLQGGTDVVIDGELAGEVVLGASLTVGPKGRVEAAVHARSVRVGGELHGDVVVDERLEVLPGGRLEGDVRAPRVAIAEGGFFRGHIDMGAPASAGGAQRAAATEPQPATQPVTARAGARTEDVRS